MVVRATLTRTVATALEEDLGRGDVTTEACVDAGQSGQVRLVAREALIFCGRQWVNEVFAQVEPAVTIDWRLDDGDRGAAGDVVARLSGPVRGLLQGERVALNFAQRASAVATLTRRFVEALPEGSRTRIVDTRKTTPGLRALERQAVRAGGGHNHREDLAAAILIKDNHVAAAGGVAAAIARARAHAPHTSRLCCEVDDHAQLDEALRAGADVVLLDNFPDAEVADAVTRVAGRALVEVSGNLSPERVAGLAMAGADVLSVGALTHSAGSVDLGFDWER